MSFHCVCQVPGAHSPALSPAPSHCPESYPRQIAVVSKIRSEFMQFLFGKLPALHSLCAAGYGPCRACLCASPADHYTTGAAFYANARRARRHGGWSCETAAAGSCFVAQGPGSRKRKLCLDKAGVRWYTPPVVPILSGLGRPCVPEPTPASTYGSGAWFVNSLAVLWKPEDPGGAWQRQIPGLEPGSARRAAHLAGGPAFPLGGEQDI